MKKHSLEAFLDACGGHEPLCLDVAAPTQGDARRQVLRQPFALIGRFERADLCLQHSGVSRRHALVLIIAGRAFCLDLASRTGTHWEGGRGHGWLPGQNPFRVGPYHVTLAQTNAPRVALPPDGWDPLARESLHRYALPAISLHILNHGITAYRWPMNRVVALVGSAECCKVRLRGPGVSKFQCALVCTPVGVWAFDLQRRGGIAINGTLVNHVLLEDGDRLQIGSFTLCVNYEIAAPSTPAAPAAPAATALAQIPGTAIGTSLMAGVLGAAGALRTLTDEGPLAAAGVRADSLSAESLTDLLRQFSAMQQQLFEQSLTMMFQMFRTMHTEQVGILRDEMARLEELNREMHTLLAERPKIAPAAPGPPTLPTATSSAAPATAATASPATDKAPLPAQPVPTADPDLHIWLCQRMEAIQRERQSLWDRIVGVIGKRN